MFQDLKAPARTCRGCQTTIAEQPSGPGRPKEFCSRPCRREFHHRQERARIEAEWLELAEAREFEHDKRFHGVREARRREKRRAKQRQARGES
jgi:hypothetical protein